MARAVVDKWKTKKAFEVIAPTIFNNNIIGTTFAKSADMLVGRTLEVPYSNVIGQGAPRSQDKFKLRFEIVSTKGMQAETKLLCFKTAQDYTQSLARKRTSKIYTAQPVKTKDGKRLMVKSFVITVRKINRSKGDAIRKRMRAFIAGEAKKKTSEEFLKDSLSNKTAMILKKDLNKLYPLRHAIVQKIELVGGAFVPVKAETPKEETPEGKEEAKE